MIWHETHETRAGDNLCNRIPAQSALEREILRWRDNLRFSLSGHDRAVVIGLALSLIPFPPLSFLGLLITLFNLGLALRRKLPTRELPLLAASMVACTGYVVLWHYLVLDAIHRDLVGQAAALARHWLGWLSSTVALHPAATPMLRQI